MASVVWSPMYPISSRLESSHRSGWAQYWASHLDADVVTSGSEVEDLIDGAKTIYVYHGMEWAGAINMQGGYTSEVEERGALLLKAASDKKKKLVSLDIKMPLYGSLLAARSPKPDRAATAVRLDGFLMKSMTLPTPPLTDWLVIGDSHSLSMSVGGENVIWRHDGQTLHGVLERGLEGYVSEEATRHGMSFNALMGLKKLTLYFGNIDVRHHLCRQPNPIEAAKELAHAYAIQGIHLQKQLKIKKLEFVELLPCENESRKIPGTGCYKGKPFWGTWGDRMSVRAAFMDRLHEIIERHSSADLYTHPRLFYNDSGELDFAVMELPRSVHIAPKFYRGKL